MASNYNDSGYTLTTGNNTYDADGNSISNQTYSVSSSDIYNNSVQCGVYKINFGNASCAMQCSSDNTYYLGTGSGADDAYIVYPGYGFRLYQDNDYNAFGVNSNIYYNTTTSVICFSVNSSDSHGTKVYQYGSSSRYNGGTQSIRVYFRGNEITVSGIS